MRWKDKDVYTCDFIMYDTSTDMLNERGHTIRDTTFNDSGGYEAITYRYGRSFNLLGNDSNTFLCIPYSYMRVSANGVVTLANGLAADMFYMGDYAKYIDIY